MLWYTPRLYFFEYGFNLVMKDYVMDVYNYVTWDDIIDLEDSKRF